MAAKTKSTAQPVGHNISPASRTPIAVATVVIALLITSYWIYVRHQTSYFANRDLRLLAWSSIQLKKSVERTSGTSAASRNGTSTRRMVRKRIGRRIRPVTTRRTRTSRTATSPDSISSNALNPKMPTRSDLRKSSPYRTAHKSSKSNRSMFRTGQRAERRCMSVRSARSRWKRSPTPFSKPGSSMISMN